MQRKKMHKQFHNFIITICHINFLKLQFSHDSINICFKGITYKTTGTINLTVQHTHLSNSNRHRFTMHTNVVKFNLI